MQILSKNSKHIFVYLLFFKSTLPISPYSILSLCVDAVHNALGSYEGVPVNNSVC